MPPGLWTVAQCFLAVSVLLALAQTDKSLTPLFGHLSIIIINATSTINY